MVTPHNGILKEQATLYVLPWNEPQDAWLGGGKRFIVHSLVLVYKKRKRGRGVERMPVGVCVCISIHTQHTNVYQSHLCAYA